MNKYARILEYFRPDWWRIALTILLTWTWTFISILSYFPMAIFIDTMSGKSVDHWAYRLFYSAVDPDDRVQQVIVLTIATVVLRLLVEVLRTTQTLMGIRIGLDGMMRVRCDLFRKLQALSIGYHKSQPQGDAIYRVAYDTYGFQGAVGILTSVLVSLGTLVFMLVIMLSMNWRLTLLSLAVVPLLLLVIRGYGQVLKTRSTEARERESSLYTTLQRSMSAIGLVQAFNREADEYSRFSSTALGSVRAAFKLHTHEVIYWLLLGLILAAGSTAIFGYGAYLVVQGTITVGYLSLFLGYLGSLYDPLNKLSGSGSGWMTAMAGVERVFQVLDRDPVIRDSPNAITLPRQPRVLELRDVGFSYRDDAPVLDGISVRIDPGSMVAFVGSSGVGKTTLLNLFPRFYDPTRGALLLDGQDIRGIKLASLRAHVALVLQESIILPTTIAENIAYGRPDATEAQVRAAAELAGAAKFIEAQPDGYDTQVSEGGSNLSGGQRQRIAIARALLTEAPIVVMDEPTSALDAEHEQLITETLRSLKRQRTIILVSHRLSTVADCDRIFVMEAGRIVEQGTHDELLAMKGAYFRMARHQMKLPEADSAT
jgi:subfamily B ATP-binding cassette protein MsbA